MQWLVWRAGADGGQMVGFIQNGKNEAETEIELCGIVSVALFSVPFFY